MSYVKSVHFEGSCGSLMAILIHRFLPNIGWQCDMSMTFLETTKKGRTLSNLKPGTQQIRHGPSETRSVTQISQPGPERPRMPLEIWHHTMEYSVLPNIKGWYASTCCSKKSVSCSWRFSIVPFQAFLVRANIPAPPCHKGFLPKATFRSPFEKHPMHAWYVRTYVCTYTCMSVYIIISYMYQYIICHFAFTHKI